MADQITREIENFTSCMMAKYGSLKEIEQGLEEEEEGLKRRQDSASPEVLLKRLSIGDEIWSIRIQMEQLWEQLHARRGYLMQQLARVLRD